MEHGATKLVNITSQHCHRSMEIGPPSSFERKKKMHVYEVVVVVRGGGSGWGEDRERKHHPGRHSYNNYMYTTSESHAWTLVRLTRRFVPYEFTRFQLANWSKQRADFVLRHGLRQVVDNEVGLAGAVILKPHYRGGGSIGNHPTPAHLSVRRWVHHAAFAQCDLKSVERGGNPKCQNHWTEGGLECNSLSL